jgi:large subunit ribosomal protein L21
MTFEVLLIGTDTYTALGRPLVKTATVDGVIESISMTEKIIVFKKKRRKQYKKSFGSRVPITSCRITKVVHNLTPELLAKAVPLS